MFLINVGSDKCVISPRFPFLFPRVSSQGLRDPHSESAGKPSVTKWAKSQLQPGPLGFYVRKKKRKTATHRAQEIKFILRDR